MNNNYTIDELNKLGFLKIGSNLKISNKSSFYGINRI